MNAISSTCRAVCGNNSETHEPDCPCWRHSKRRLQASAAGLEEAGARIGAGERLPIAPLQFGLVVEGVDLRRPAGHEQPDDRAHPGSMMRLPRLARGLARARATPGRASRGPCRLAGGSGGGRGGGAGHGSLAFSLSPDSILTARGSNSIACGIQQSDFSVPISCPWAHIVLMPLHPSKPQHPFKRRRSGCFLVLITSFRLTIHCPSVAVKNSPSDSAKDPFGR